MHPRGPRDSGPPILIAGKGPRMLQNVARHADAWNAAWYGNPMELDELDGPGRATAGRLRGGRARPGDPDADSRSLRGLPGFALAGSRGAAGQRHARVTDEAGAMLADYRDHAIDHLIVHLWPRSPAAVEALGRAA